MHNFPTVREDIKRNITEVRSIINNPNVLDPLDRKVFDRGIYLFQSIAKEMIRIGNNIIIMHGYRPPLNTADVFISLAEHSVIPPTIVPGMKKAAIAIPRIDRYPGGQMIAVMADCLDDFSRCLASYDTYFQKKEIGDPECR